MSEFRIDQITNQSETAGPNLAGITTFSATSGMLMPSGDTFKRNVVENVVKDGLVLYLDAGNNTSYPGSGTTWYDLSEGANSGTLVNGVSYNSSNGGFLSFDGVNDYVNLGQSNKFASNNLTLDVWLNLPSGTNQGKRPISNYNGGDFENGDFNLRIDGSGTYERRPCLEIGTGASQGNQFFSDTLIDYDVWYNITCVYNSSSSPKGLIYINSSLVSTTVLGGGGGASGTILNNTAPLYVASIPTSSQQFSLLKTSSIKIYKRSLTSQEIQQNFQALRGRYGL
jgi:hypothetical protein